VAVATIPATAAPTARQMMSSDAVKTHGSGFISCRLLQLDVLRHHGRSDEPAAVCSECGCAIGVGRSTLRL